jgi:LmbE family N-acetylglucosaminyl deacetylase
MSFSSAIGVFLIAGLIALIIFRFYIRRPPSQAELPLPLGRGALGSSAGAVLVFAPHSDDETLGVGGVIAETVAAGGRVKVVLVTSGDGFPAATEEKPGRPARERFIELGYLRQEETVAALGLLGLARKDVIFLGYPDRGLGPMWEQYWDYGAPYASPYTATSHSPYRDSFEVGASYCGRGVVDNLKKIITTFAPEEIVVSHPSDAHPDHWATFALVTYALEQLRAEGYAQGRRIPVYTYLVHCGDWPRPRGYHPNQPLDPPRGLAGLTTQWYEYELAGTTVEKKRRAVEAYASQTSLAPLFLKSFVRRTELFGLLPAVTAARLDATSGSADLAAVEAERWREVKPASLDPPGEIGLARRDASADLRAVSAAVDGRDLYFLLTLRGKPASEIRYVVRLAGLGSGPDRERVFYELKTTADGIEVVTVNGSDRSLGAERLKQAARVRRTGSALEIAVSLETVGRPARVLVSAQTQIEAAVVDSTEWTVLELP